jgi:integrase
MVSSKSTHKADAIKLREGILKPKMAGSLPGREASKITCGELLDDVLRHILENGKASTAKIWKLVIEANLRPFFGNIKAAAITTDKLRAYRDQRKAAGRSEATCNRELSTLRTAFNLGRKCTPPKVDRLPYFPLVSEEGNARQGFLTDQQYAKLRDALPDDLKPLFITAYFTGVRVGELLAWCWEQVDFEQGFVTLNAEETKSGYARVVPILAGDMRDWLTWAHEQSDGCPQVFNRAGEPSKDFRWAWGKACEVAEVRDLKFHDLRRTAVRNMRRAGVSQVVRMRITGHRTDSMERRYNIVDVEDIRFALNWSAGFRRIPNERNTGILLDPFDDRSGACAWDLQSAAPYGGDLCGFNRRIRNHQDSANTVMGRPADLVSFRCVVSCLCLRLVFRGDLGEAAADFSNVFVADRFRLCCQTDEIGGKDGEAPAFHRCVHPVRGLEPLAGIEAEEGRQARINEPFEYDRRTRGLR